MSNHTSMYRVIVGLSLLVAVEAAARDTRPSGSPTRRARRPDWPPEVVATFFEDARTMLVGLRPVLQPQANSTGDSTAATDAAPDEELTWSTLISGDALETEIKRTVKRLGAGLSSRPQFAGGGHLDCRREFGLLAVLFGIIERHDEPVRWQAQAAGLRQLFTRASAMCQVGSEQVHRQAQLRYQDLQDLVRGSRIARAPGQPLGAWNLVSDRGPLMQRLEVALEENLSPAMADRATFARQRAAIGHEAQLLAALAALIARDDFESADDEEFIHYADQLRQAAVDLTRAAEENDYRRARAAAGNVSQACSDCHDGYRG